MRKAAEAFVAALDGYTLADLVAPRDEISVARSRRVSLISGRACFAIPAGGVTPVL